MSIWPAVKQFLSLSPDLPIAQRAAPPTEMFGPLGQRAADWSGIHTGEKVRDAWAKCATAFSCLTLLADAVASAALFVAGEVAASWQPASAAAAPRTTTEANGFIRVRLLRRKTRVRH